MELTDSDYRILRLVKRRGPLDATVIKSRLGKFGVTDQRLRELSRRPRFYAGPETLVDNRLLICEEHDGRDVYTLAPAGVQALCARSREKKNRLIVNFLAPTMVAILAGLVLYVLQQLLLL